MRWGRLGPGGRRTERAPGGQVAGGRRYLVGDEDLSSRSPWSSIVTPSTPSRSRNPARRNAAGAQTCGRTGRAAVAGQEPGRVEGRVGRSPTTWPPRAAAAGSWPLRPRPVAPVPRQASARHRTEAVNAEDPRLGRLDRGRQEEVVRWLPPVGLSLSNPAWTRMWFAALRQVAGVTQAHACWGQPDILPTSMSTTTVPCRHGAGDDSRQPGRPMTEPTSWRRCRARQRRPAVLGPGGRHR